MKFRLALTLKTSLNATRLCFISAAGLPTRRLRQAQNDKPQRTRRSTTQSTQKKHDEDKLSPSNLFLLGTQTGIL
jgi:hypothetical protein